jgi:hypothetical protein
MRVTQSDGQLTAHDCILLPCWKNINSSMMQHVQNCADMKNLYSAKHLAIAVPLVKQQQQRDAD